VTRSIPDACCLARAEQCIEVHRQNVAFDHLNVWDQREVHPKLRGQHAVGFDGDHPAGAPHQH